MRIFESHLKEKFFPAGTVSCDSVVTTLLLTLSQHCGTIKNELRRRQFPKL